MPIIEMTSTLSSFAQRKSNVIAVVPVLDGKYRVLSIDPRHCSLFTVDMTTQIPGDTNATVNYYGFGNLIGQKIYYYYFDMDPKIAKSYPGLEFTVFFKNCGYVPEPNNSLIDLYPPNTNYSDVLSQPQQMRYFNTLSVTFKSDGDLFSITSTGQSPWTYFGYDSGTPV